MDITYVTEMQNPKKQIAAQSPRFSGELKCNTRAVRDALVWHVVPEFVSDLHPVAWVNIDINIDYIYIYYIYIYSLVMSSNHLLRSWYQHWHVVYHSISLTIHCQKLCSLHFITSWCAIITMYIYHHLSSSIIIYLHLSTSIYIYLHL